MVNPNWTNVKTYLTNLYDSALSLCREYPGATRYWTCNDNALAARAFNYLPSSDPTKRDVIIAKLQRLKICGCGDVPTHDGFTNHHMDPVVHKAAQIPLTPRSACGTLSAPRKPRQVSNTTDNCNSTGAFCPSQDIRHEDHPVNGWGADQCNSIGCSTSNETGWDSSGQGHGYANLIALEILNYRNRGMATDPLWNLLNGKWDGKGMNDQSTTDYSDHHYETYKLSLFKICARVLGKTLPTGVDDKLTAAQGSNGGIRTTYNSSGNFTLDQIGNCETTSLAVLAFLKPVSDF